MILKKPYAFFIKIFRPLHFVFAICIAVLIMHQNKMLNFLNNYLYTNELVDTKNIKIEIINSLIFVLPIMLLLLSLLLFGIMYKKNKPFKFYLISIFLYIAILIINIYASSFFSAMEKTTIAIKSVKLIHDFILMTIITETILIIIYVVRAIGINFKKFDFSSDIAKFDINDTDKEEFELDIKLDFNESKRKRREKIRNLKYFYLEHKFFVNLISLSLFVLILTISIFLIKNKNSHNEEKKEYSLTDFDLIIEKSSILNTNYEGDLITDNYLIVVEAKMKSLFQSKSLFLKDFNLKIGDSMFYPTNKYNDYLVDLGEIYKNQILTNEYVTYLFVYEIPHKFITSDMYFRYSDKGYNFDIKLNPKNLKYGSEKVKSEKNKEIDFNKSLGNIKFNINNYEINDYYKIDYEYCSSIKCINSIEYLRPTIDENYDKTILKLDVDYTNNSKLEINSFYNLLDSFGDLYYKIDGKWNIQYDGFEEIVSKKGKNIYNYIGVNSAVKNAQNIKFVFNIRGLKYEYTIK